MEQSDLAHWLLELLKRGRSGQAYNVGSDRAISMLGLAHTVREIVAPHKRVNVICSPSQTPPRNCYLPCIAKARNELGLKVTIDLEDAIRISSSVHLCHDT